MQSIAVNEVLEKVNESLLKGKLIADLTEKEISYQGEGFTYGTINR
jgi:hypothetical protein